MPDQPMNDLLSQSINQIDDLLYIFTPDGDYLEWNDAVESVTGYSDDEIEDLHPTDTISADDREAVSDAIQRVVENGESMSVEADLLTKDGARLPYEFTGSPIESDDGDVVAIAGVGRDISDIKRRERELQAMAEELREMSMPIVEVWDGVLLSTVVGRLDSHRAEQFTEEILQRINEQNASIAIIDITGVSTIDTQTAQHLIDTIQAIELLGTDIIMTGIHPEISQTLVSLGIGFDVETQSSLSDGLETALEWKEAR